LARALIAEPQRMSRGASPHPAVTRDAASMTSTRPLISPSPDRLPDFVSSSTPSPSPFPSPAIAMASQTLVPVLVTMMLLTGVCNTLLTKYQDLQCVRNCDDPSKAEYFEQPVLQT
jgi:hypothetical protein